MRSLVAVVLAHALVASTAVGASLHVHEYVGHDHPDHHHGPATHEHHQPAVAADDHRDKTEDQGVPALHADSCDPGQHAVAVRMGCVHVPQLHVDIAELLGPTVLVPPALVQSVSPITDVRAHGPPFDLHLPSRAPPLTHLA